MAKQIIRLTENDFHKIIRNSVNKVLKEYIEPDIDRYNAENEFRDNYDWGAEDEDLYDYFNDPDQYKDEWNVDFSDGDLYRGM